MYIYIYIYMQTYTYTHMYINTPTLHDFNVKYTLQFCSQYDNSYTFLLEISFKIFTILLTPRTQFILRYNHIDRKQHSQCLNTFPDRNLAIKCAWIQNRRRASVDRRNYWLIPIRRVGKVIADVKRARLHVTDYLTVERVYQGRERDSCLKQTGLSRNV